jgi:hypothetical protein
VQIARLRQRNPQLLKQRRARSYQLLKKDPERLSKHRDGAKKYRQYGREWLAAYKLEKGCADCGYRGHSAALQLDHEGHKSIDIADARSSIARLMKEIEDGRCVVRCANCHSIRTWEQKQRLAFVTTTPGGNHRGRGCGE